MVWRCKKPGGHRQLWYWISLPWIFQSQHQKCYIFFKHTLVTDVMDISCETTRSESRTISRMRINTDSIADLASGQWWEINTLCRVWRSRILLQLHWYFTPFFKLLITYSEQWGEVFGLVCQFCEPLNLLELLLNAAMQLTVLLQWVCQSCSPFLS